ncbi:MAG: hypothetical protein O2893_01570 [Cyanobacteria bacterium]|jgi:hypothetical protein|nr:hypothetical protein [Cyanobacteriota bacterium]MDA1169832.1 hypothetical protein [Cyanobacteriota bacterium]
MSLDPKSAQRLQELGRSLPQALPTPTAKETTSLRKLHAVETEENPEELFRQLIQVSSDGNIPTHLMDRLKFIEKQSLNKSKNEAQNKSKLSIKSNKKDKLSDSIENSLYVEFQQMLLEQDD